MKKIILTMLISVAFVTPVFAETYRATLYNVGTANMTVEGAIVSIKMRGKTNIYEKEASKFGCSFMAATNRGIMHFCGKKIKDHKGTVIGSLRLK